MPKKAKLGKNRQDKFYKLAKESGFRSRAAFKLLQLNRKYEFLSKARVCIDLCAAPGGWMQVANQGMPMSSLVIGVDLVPIRPVANCITLQEDITTDRCRSALKKELSTWKADVVLNDGAPNVGQNWLHDAYQQNVLTLSALKLATEFLNKGGTFVTKVFRSKDYQALLTVLGKLFKRVISTKPQASRSESAEIFVVCLQYNGHVSDHKLLDPKYVFEDVEEEKAKMNVLHPDKKKNRAIGYPEGKRLLYTEVKATDFILCKDHLELLADCTEIKIDNNALLRHPLTTKEVLECCRDIKVLGRKELRTLLNWRKEMKKIIESKEEETTQVEEEDEEEEKIGKEIEELESEEQQEQKRKKKRLLKEKRKRQKQIELKMVIKDDQLEIQEQELFKLRTMGSKKALQNIQESKPDEVTESEDKKNIKPKTERIVEGSKLHKSGQYYTNSDESEDGQSDMDDERIVEGLNLSDNESSKSESDAEECEGDDEENPLLLDLQVGSKEEKQKRKADKWFTRGAFESMQLSDDEDYELDRMIEEYEKKGGKLVAKKEKTVKTTTDIDSESDNKESGYTSDSNQSDTEPDDVDQSDDRDDNTDESDDDKAISGLKKEEVQTDTGEIEVVPKENVKRKLTAEGMALGSMMIRSQKTKRDLMDEGWNRYAFNDENLPDWFVQDEKKHREKAVPVTKELVEEYKQKLKEINARPIKKVIEAKARKKKRMVNRMEKARKRAEKVTENVDLTDREKAQKVKEIYKKMKQKKVEVQYVVAKKSNSGRRVRKPAHVKGPYKVVDKRMKKDDRKRKSTEKQERKKKGNGPGKNKRRMKR